MNTLIPSYFSAPPREASAQIISGRGVTHDRRVTIAATTIDHLSGLDNAIEMKVWGDIDPNFRRGEFGISEGGSRWVPYEPSFPVILSIGDGTKTVQIRIRNSSMVLTGALVAEVELDAADTPHASILWSHVPRPLRSGKPTRIAWSPSADIDAWEIVLLPSTDALHADGVIVVDGESVSAGTLVHTLIDDGDIAAVDQYPSANGSRVLRLYVLVGSTWYASGGFGGEPETLPEFNWDDGNWDEGVWA